MINSGAVEKLFEEGFTSLEALRLLDEEDLSEVKIPHDNNNDEQKVGAHSQALDSYVQGLLNQIVQGNNRTAPM